MSQLKDVGRAVRPDVNTGRALLPDCLDGHECPSYWRWVSRQLLRCDGVLAVAIAVLLAAATADAQYQPPGAYAPSAQGVPTIPSASYPPSSTFPAADAPQGIAGDAAEGSDVAEPGAAAVPGVWGRILQGGPLMIPLGICSLVVLALAMERMIALRRGRVIPRPFVRRFTECVEDGQLSYDEAAEICDEFDCPVAEVFHAAVKRWGRPVIEVEQAVMDAGDRVAEGLRRFLRVFHAISNVAPLIGLLGTVLGMIEAFEMMSSQQADGRPEMLASGISVALITTAGGLCVAIPAYLAYIYFSSKADRYLGEIDSLCQKVIDSISAEGLQTAGSARGGRKTRRAA